MRALHFATEDAATILNFSRRCRDRGISPHAACKEEVNIAGLDKRTTKTSGYAVSLRIRKRIEEIIGWIKTVGGLRRSRYRGMERTRAWGYFVAGAYNLLRLIRLATDWLATGTPRSRSTVRESSSKVLWYSSSRRMLSSTSVTGPWALMK